MNSQHLNRITTSPMIALLSSQSDADDWLRSTLAQQGYSIQQATTLDNLDDLNEDCAVILWNRSTAVPTRAYLAELRQRHPHTSLILMGCESKDDLVHQALSLDFHDYLLDPGHLDELRLKILRAVDLWQLRLAEAHHHRFIDQVQQELSDCKAIEMTLRESEERYRTLIEKSPDAIYLIYNGRFEVINTKFTELFGVSLADAQAPNFVFTSIISPKGYNWPATEKDQLPHNRPAPNGRHDGPHYEFVGLNKEGQEIELELYVSYLPYKNGLATQGILRDITERKQLERQLHQAQRMEAVGRLAGGIAHDFNNILTVISGLAALGLRRLAKEDLFYQDLVTIQNQTQRAAELVRQLLAFSWRKTLKIRPLNLNHIVQGLSPILKRALGEKIDVHISLTPGLPLIQGDTNAVEQILTNLALNAREVMPSGGHFTIQTEAVTLDRATARLRLDAKPGHYVRITATDTGMGMDEETQKRIFEPFFTTREANQGTGMGLTVVYGLVKEQAGFIEVNSQLQQGTAFQVYFPVSAEQTLEAPTRKHENGQSPANGKTILLIEDDQTVRHLVQRVLNRAGYGVVTAEDGHTALEIVQNGKGNIDLIITDVVMPKMDGNKLFNAIRALGLNHEPQFIFMSGYRQDGIQNEGLLCDVPEANFLGKPFSPTDLTEKIHQVLSREQV